MRAVKVKFGETHAVTTEKESKHKQEIGIFCNSGGIEITGANASRFVVYDADPAAISCYTCREENGLNHQEENGNDNNHPAQR